MVYNDTSTRNGLLQSCEFLCGLGDAGISGDTNLKAHFTRLLNDRQYQMLAMVFDSQDEWDFDDVNLASNDYPVATTPLVAAQRDYTFPTSLKILRLKRVDVTYDGTNWYKAEPFDSGETGMGLGNDTNTDARFSKTQPYYDLRGNSLWLYPLANAADVTANAKVRVEFLRELYEYTTSDTTKTPPFDKPFHNMPAIGASLDFAVSRGLANKNDLATLWAIQEEKLKSYYSQKDMDRELIMKPAFNDYN